MHTEIKSYWERIGRIESKHFPLFKVTEYRCIYENGLRILIVAIIRDNGSGDYWFRGKARSEEEMLRIVRLKAFS